MIDIMAVETVYRKASWTIPSDVLDLVQQRVPHGQVSAYVTKALRRQLELDNLASLVEEMEAEGGPVDEVNVARYAEEMR
jgi:thymidine phosphorylase